MWFLDNIPHRVNQAVVQKDRTHAIIPTGARCQYQQEKQSNRIAYLVGRWVGLLAKKARCVWRLLH